MPRGGRDQPLLPTRRHESDRSGHDGAVSDATLVEISRHAATGSGPLAGRQVPRGRPFGHRRIGNAKAYHRPAIPLDHDAVADMLNVVLEGGFIMSKVFDDAQLLVRYLRALRAFLEASFGIALTAGSTSGDRARRSGSGPDRARA